MAYAYSNRDEIDLNVPLLREFRVKCVRRYIVTDWSDYRGGSEASVRQIGEFDSATQATEVAKMFGLANPGALVNGMDEPDENRPPVSLAAAEERIKHMVARFLAWRLPESFSPDGGISFKKTFNEHTAHPMKHEPIGTNLFDATQAEAMVRHMVEGL